MMGHLAFELIRRFFGQPVVKIAVVILLIAVVWFWGL